MLLILALLVFRRALGSFNDLFKRNVLLAKKAISLFRETLCVCYIERKLYFKIRDCNGYRGAELAMTCVYKTILNVDGVLSLESEVCGFDNKNPIMLAYFSLCCYNHIELKPDGNILDWVLFQTLTKYQELERFVVCEKPL